MNHEIQWCCIGILPFFPIQFFSEDDSAGWGLGEECRAVRASKPRRLFIRTDASKEVFFSLIEKNFRGREKNCQPLHAESVKLGKAS
jgi:hypothetical protein